MVVWTGRKSHQTGHFTVKNRVGFGRTEVSIPPFEYSPRDLKHGHGFRGGLQKGRPNVDIYVFRIAYDGFHENHERNGSGWSVGLRMIPNDWARSGRGPRRAFDLKHQSRNKSNSKTKKSSLPKDPKHGKAEQFWGLTGGPQSGGRQAQATDFGPGTPLTWLADFGPGTPLTWLGAYWGPTVWGPTGCTTDFRPGTPFTWLGAY